MSHDLTQETLITFATLAKRQPRRQRGRPVHVSTIHRWRNPGIRGVRLEAVRAGAAWVTSMEAFGRFCRRLTDLEGGTAAISIHRTRQEATIDRELAEEGL